MDGYDGVVTTDGYAVYKMFDRDGKHQLCWAHELRAAKYDALRLSAGPEAGRLTGTRCGFTKRDNPRDHAVPSMRLRSSMEDAMRYKIQTYAESDDEKLEATAARLLRAVPTVCIPAVPGGRSDKQRHGAGSAVRGGVAQDQRADQGREQGHEADVEFRVMRPDVAEAGAVGGRGGGKDRVTDPTPPPLMVGQGWDGGVLLMIGMRHRWGR